MPYSEQTSLKADVTVVFFLCCNYLFVACNPSQTLNFYIAGLATSSLVSACYLLQSRQQLNICSMNDHLLCPRWSDFCFLFVLFFKRFKILQIFRRQNDTNESLRFSNVNVPKDHLGDSFQVQTPRLEVTRYLF